ncbi:hypothetical protein CFP75_05200 [Amycolatopsis alba DSM 44262]|uniref:Uncharacterized protein n=1 Tax=Amycolatopsis alba DSM 44262 TaxID=1125972 RepID=A0A229S6C5_AMYAL|nr:hypothetical protein CFP75_05200 [Amycolatopsis alba DSM 44262]
MPSWFLATLPVVASLLTAGAAYLGVRHAARGNDRATGQREAAARREEWWRRFTWAVDLARDQSSEENRVLGLTLLTALAESDLAQEDELRLLEVFSQRQLEEHTCGLSNLVEEHEAQAEEA